MDAAGASLRGQLLGIEAETRSAPAIPAGINLTPEKLALVAFLGDLSGTIRDGSGR